MHCVGFAPFFTEQSKILILGSFPSVKSREVNFYYGNRQNRFWKILSEYFCEPLPNDIEEKKALLANHGVALWDVVTECDIEGSMDKDIHNPIIADVPALLAIIPCEKIFCNGNASYKLLMQNFPHLSIITTKLPSTSPANGRFDKGKWIEALTEVFLSK